MYEVSHTKRFFTFIGAGIFIAGLVALLVILYVTNQRIWLDKNWPTGKTVSSKPNNVDADSNQDGTVRTATQSQSEAQPESSSNSQTSIPITSLTLKESSNPRQFSFVSNGDNEYGYFFVWYRVDRAGYENVRYLEKDDPGRLYYEGQSDKGFNYSGSPQKGSLDISSFNGFITSGQYKIYICTNKNGQCGTKSNLILKQY